jgi:hypothetical protein
MMPISGSLAAFIAAASLVTVAPGVTTLLVHRMAAI